MIALKTNPAMSSEVLSFDSALLSPADQSFFTDDCLQTQHCSEITDEWLQEFDDIRRFCDGFELGLNNEPELSLEAITKEVDTQYPSKADEFIDYLDSTAFLSPESLEPSSPPQPQYAEQDTGLDSDAAISLLEEILVANADGNSLSSEQCYDDLTTPYDSEASMTCDSPPAAVVPEARPKRQPKRKAPEMDEPVAKTKAKRGKSSTEAKRERKRKQNKSAANRYRQKKRAELDGIERQQQGFEETNAQLKAQLQKLQMEFKVVYPLAKAAFASDPNRSLQLQMLDIRVLTDELLE